MEAPEVKFKLPIPNLDFQMQGHSRAAQATQFFIKQMSVALDAGGMAEVSGNTGRSIRPKHVFLSHTHLDHAKEAHMMLTHMHEVNYYLHKDSESYFDNYLSAAHQMNSNSSTKSTCLHKLNPLVGGEQFIIEGKYKVEVLQTYHSVPSLGFGFLEIKKKLKPEYQNLKGQEIASLRKQGIEITEENLIPLFFYTGDTGVSFYEKNPQVFKYPVIIAECTYLNKGEEEKALKNAHTHFSQLKPFVEANSKVQFILFHFSCKYSDKEVMEFFKKEAIPNVFPWLDGFTKE